MKQEMKRKIQKAKKGGFTLIELIVVLAILGILVLLAAPKFIGYVAEAKMTQVKNDIKAYENAITAKLQKDDTLTKTWDPISRDKLIEERDKDAIFDTKGEIPDNYEFKDYYLDIPEDKLSEDIKSKLEGDFVWSANDGKVYYIDSSLTGTSDNDQSKDTDGDGLTDEEENDLGTDIDKIDTDGDNLTDKEEVDNGTDPLDPTDPGNDQDGDGIQDHVEDADGTDKTKSDTDDDGLDDKQEKDKGTNPNNPDTDSDGVEDGQEITDGTDPLKGDTDGDGLNDGEEKQEGTNPLSPDTDNDQISDGQEVTNGTDPLDPNDPGKDTDGDGLKDHEEDQLGTDKTKPDTDGDGLNDKDDTAPLDPNSPNDNRDTDGDGLTNDEEKDLTTDPNKSDTDGDGINDGEEITDGTDPLDPNSVKDKSKPTIDFTYGGFSSVTSSGTIQRYALSLTATDNVALAGLKYFNQPAYAYWDTPVASFNSFGQAKYDISVADFASLKGTEVTYGFEDPSGNKLEMILYWDSNYAYTWEAGTNEAIIIGMFTSMDTNSFSLPATVKGKNIVGITTGMNNAPNLKTLTIPETYKYIHTLVLYAENLETLNYNGTGLEIKRPDRPQFTGSGKQFVIKGKNLAAIKKLSEDINAANSGQARTTYQQIQ